MRENPCTTIVLTLSPCADLVELIAANLRELCAQILIASTVILSHTKSPHKKEKEAKKIRCGGEGKKREQKSALPMDTFFTRHRGSQLGRFAYPTPQILPTLYLFFSRKR